MPAVYRFPNYITDCLSPNMPYPVERHHLTFINILTHNKAGSFMLCQEQNETTSEYNVASTEHGHMFFRAKEVSLTDTSVENVN